jgi:hypothetical protein
MSCLLVLTPNRRENNPALFFRYKAEHGIIVGTQSDDTGLKRAVEFYVVRRYKDSHREDADVVCRIWP